MFYCNPCARERGYPTDTLSQSVGPCELCGRHGVMNDVQSKFLPAPEQPPTVTLTRAELEGAMLPHCTPAGIERTLRSFFHDKDDRGNPTHGT